MVQILSSDDEDNQAGLESGNGSQTGAMPPVSSSSVAAQPSVTTQESQESCPEVRTSVCIIVELMHLYVDHLIKAFLTACIQEFIHLHQWRS